MFKYSNNTDILSNLYDLYDRKIEEFGYDLWHIAENLNGAKYAKSRRLWKKVKKMLENGKCYFLTLTFLDADLSHSTFKERRRWVTEYLKSQTDYYIANIDFGEKNGREHYHAIIRIDEFNGDNAKQWSEHHREFLKEKDKRNLDFKKCYSSSETSAKKMAKYVTKLTSHALKDTNISNRVIYSRKINLL